MRKEGYKNVVRDKLYYLDTEFDPAKVNEANYIKMQSPLIVSLENFKTVIKAGGIDLTPMD